jgi:hypothetical protein
MEDNYVISVRTKTGRIVLKAEKCHDAKSIAGTLFYYSPKIISAYAGDKTGKAFFYGRKDEDGHVIQEKTVNVPSTEAIFG